MKRLCFLFSALASLATPVLAADMVEVAVIAAPVQRGEIIDAGTLSNKMVTASEARGALPEANIIGQEARRVLQPGTIVRTFDVKAPDLIKKGQTVSMIVSRGPLTIAALGRAMEDGSKGKTIKIQNISSKQVIEGEISGPGQVKIITPGAPVIPANI